MSMTESFEVFRRNARATRGLRAAAAVARSCRGVGPVSELEALDALRAFRRRRVFAQMERYRVISVMAPPAQPHCHGRIRHILAQVSAAHGVPELDILSSRRGRLIARARQEVMYRAATETAASLPQIARVLDRDPTCVLHGIRAHRRRMGGEP
jgi:chromosomal replication initiation ATPase DnaA